LCSLFEEASLFSYNRTLCHKTPCVAKPFYDKYPNDKTPCHKSPSRQFTLAATTLSLLFNNKTPFHYFVLLKPD